MRFRIDLKVEAASGYVLPLNYQYELSAAIYKCMSRSDADYAAWLHDNGFTDAGPGSKRLKLFCFSNLRLPRFAVESDRLKIDSDRVSFYLSFLPEKSTVAFVKGAFADQVFEVGDRISRVRFRVTDITILPPLSEKVWVDSDGMAEGNCRTLSPICVSLRASGAAHAEFLAPEDPRMAACLLKNLEQKYKFFYGSDYAGVRDFEFVPTAAVRRKCIAMKRFTPQETKVIGYQYEFRLRCASVLLDVAGDCGLGEKGSMGFGFVDVR